MNFSFRELEVHSKPLRFWILSLLLHAGVVALFSQSIQIQKLKTSVPIPIEWIDDGKNREQIVFSKVRTHSDPKKNAFLGEKNQVVAKETVSRETGTQVGSVIRAKPREQNRVSPQKMDLRHFGLRYSLQTPAEQKQMVQDGSLNQAAGAEYLKGFEEGRETLLNTKEFVFFGYFQRVRQSLDKAWSLQLSEEMRHFFNRGRRLAESRDYTTQVLVTLDHQGHVKRIQLVEVSGTEDLDSAAVKAFDSAGPFPNPPKGLIDSQGLVKIRWDFVVKT